MNIKTKRNAWLVLLFIFTLGLAVSACSTSQKHCDGMNSAKRSHSANR